MKKIMQLTVLFTCIILNACNSDEPNNPDNPNNPSTNNSSVVIKADGSTSTGVVFSPIDETTFFLDFIKYKIVDSHLEIIGYDPIEISEDVKPYAYVTYLGTTYTTRTIGREAFIYCSKIKSLNLPVGLKNIEEYAFYLCNLVYLNIPDGLESIGNFAFYGNKLESIKSFATNPPDIVSYSFSYLEGILYVPSESVELYKNTDIWKNFKNIQGI